MSIWMSAALEWQLEQERKTVIKILGEEGIAVPDCLSGSFLAGAEHGGEMENKDIFTHETTFRKVPFQTEFMRENGDVWYKDAPDSASKVNWPNSGNFRDFGQNEKVWLDPINARGTI